MLHIFVFALFLTRLFELVCIVFLFDRTKGAAEPEEAGEEKEREEQKKRMENLNEIFDYDPYRR